MGAVKDWCWDEDDILVLNPSLEEPVDEEFLTLALDEISFEDWGADR